MTTLSTRFDTVLTELANNNQGAFIPFVTLCDPTLDKSFDIICTMVDNGADALELGFPFSDPLLDGEVIQHANQRVLQAGFSSEASFQLLAKVRDKYPNIPISLLLCANLVFAKGIDTFYHRCAEIGVDAVLVADVPLIECETFCQSAIQHGINPVLICPPNGDEETIAEIAKRSKGYVYLVSRAGVTSADNQGQADNLAVLVNQLKEHNSAPVLQGFGISSPEQVQSALNNGCAGAISGSAIVRIIANNLDNHEKTLQELAKFVGKMKEATKVG